MLEGKTILLAEGDLPARRLLSEALHRQGCRVLEANSGSDAVEVSRRYRGAIDVLIANCEMPGISGLDLAEDLSLSNPGLQIIFLGNPKDSEAEGGRFRFIRKPFDPATIRDLIEAGLAARKAV